MPRHFLIYLGGGTAGGHNVVYLACAETPLAAIHAYLRNQGLEVTEEGNVVWRDGRRALRYSHALAYIEAELRPWHEWLIREIPPAAWALPMAEVMCGEDIKDVEHHVQQCRPLLQREFPRSRAQAFLWYLQDGVVVTFYQRVRRDQIRVLRRFIHVWGEGEYRPWNGAYDELLERLLLRPTPQSEPG